MAISSLPLLQKKKDIIMKIITFIYILYDNLLCVKIYMDQRFFLKKSTCGKFAPV